jgi:transglutaminase-like putative cysteine protease
MSEALAQNARIEESVTDIVCDGPTHAIQHFKEVTTILNEQAASLAPFVCSCSKNDRLTSFKGLVTDASGRVIRKLKENELQKTEYSQYLAVDDYKMFLDYTPPVYPVTISYEWTIDSRDNLVEFPPFCPQTDYDVSVKHASYSLKAPKNMGIRYALQQINAQVSVSEPAQHTQLFTLELNDIPMLKKEPYAKPLRERMPKAYFAPTDFVYYGTNGSLLDWTEYGKWEYRFIQGMDELPDAVRQQIHGMTDSLKTKREKVETLYKWLGETTRYVAVLLGIGGQQPAPPAHVNRSGFGDCKGLSNYMRALLKEVGIASNYTTISTYNRRLLKNFASVGQMNHVILQVPLEGDTLWLECTNPQLPMGYVHEDIAGHDAIEISKNGGRLVTLPVYADSANLMHSDIHIRLDVSGAADLTLSQETRNRQYENGIPLLKMDAKERQRFLQKIVHMPQAEITKVDVSEEGAMMRLTAEVKSQKYATQTGQRLFVPVCPVHQGYSMPSAQPNRQEDIWIDMGYLDKDDITFEIPNGFTIEAKPKDVVIEHPFASFSFSVEAGEKEIHVKNRLLMKSGTFDKALYPQLADFFKSISNIYGQKIVLKKKD